MQTKTGAQETLLKIVGTIVIILAVIAGISVFLYVFYNSLTETGRMSALIILTWLVLIAFALGTGFGFAMVHGFKIGREHSEKVLGFTSQAPLTAYTPPTETIIDLTSAPGMITGPSADRILESWGHNA